MRDESGSVIGLEVLSLDTEAVAEVLGAIEFVVDNASTLSQNKKRKPIAIVDIDNESNVDVRKPSCRGSLPRTEADRVIRLRNTKVSAFPTLPMEKTAWKQKMNRSNVLFAKMHCVPGRVISKWKVFLAISFRTNRIEYNICKNNNSYYNSHQNHIDNRMIDDR